MNKAKNLTSTNLDSYLHSLYTASHTKESFSAFSAKAYSIMSNLPKDYVSLDSTQQYTTLSTLVKSNTIDIESLHYIVDNSIFFEGFQNHILTSMQSDFDTLKNRPRAKKAPITFDSLDSLLEDSLDISIGK
ncbi:MAG: hypothetical protein J6V40_02990 [Clostridia bacterium]|nr:hypothetical protein [Clostridia bacterium]